MNVPFRLGTTSFIHPGSWVENVQQLAGRVADVELLFFESGELPDDDEVEALAAWKQRAELTYSLHTPLDVSLASTSAARRAAALASVRLAIDTAAPLEPEVTIVHVYLGEHEHDEHVPADLGAWRRRAARSLEALLDSIAPAELCVEILDYDFALIEPVVIDLGLSVAVDIGHLVRDGRDEKATLLRHLHRTRVVQWHGIDPSGRDHRGLAHYPRDSARWLFDTLVREAYRGVLTLEVFRAADLDESLAVVAALAQEQRS